MADSPMWLEYDEGTEPYNASEYRHLLQVLTGGMEGVYPTASGLRVTATTGLTVSIAAGTAVLVGDSVADQGTYAQHIYPAVTKTLEAANASNPRIDVIGIQIKDKESAGTEWSGDVVVVKGTASGSPSVPSFPANFYPLAQIAVAANATTITSGNITSLRQGIIPRYGWDEAAGILRPWDCAWGYMGHAIQASIASTSAGIPVDIGVEVTWDAVTNRRYKTTLVCPRIQQLSFAGEDSIMITNPGGTAFKTNVMWRLTNETWSTSLSLYDDSFTTGASVTRKGRVSTTAGFVSVFATGDQKAELIVEDIGPSGPPP